MKKVGVIGGSGFIDDEMISILLKNHFYIKVGTDDISEKKNFEHLMDLKYNENLHVCELDSMSKIEIDNFSKDCDYLIMMNSIQRTDLN